MSAHERHDLIRALCKEKRTTLLSEVLGTRIPERVLRWTGLAAWDEFSLGDWNEFFRFALAEERHSAISRAQVITRTLLEQFHLIPEPLRRKGLLSVVSRLEIPAHRWKSLSDNFANVDPGMRPALLRKSATMKFRGEFWDLYFRCEGKYWRHFRLPATLPPSELLEPIASPLEMDAEGRSMKNCLSSCISRVHSGDCIYFRLRDGTPVNAELMRESSGWVPGRILGPDNEQIPKAIATEVRDELLRMGRAISDEATNFKDKDGYVELLRQKAREIFCKEDIDTVTQHLDAIHGRSVSWGNSAYVIFVMRHGGFIQFMDSPDTKEYLCEIQSYQFAMRDGEFLDAKAVDLIERAGFVWPVSRENFVRWFKDSSPADIRGIAEFALSVLHTLFHCRSVEEINVRSRIPPEQEFGIAQTKTTITQAPQRKPRSPEVQKRLDAFHEGIAQEMVDTLNGNVRKQDPPKPASNK